MPDTASATAPGTPVATPGRPASRFVAWIGGAPGLELAWARHATGQRVRVIDLATPLAPWPDAPTLAVLAADAPGRWQLDDCIRLARRWPLAVTVAVATTLGDGRRRSGPALPGVEEIPWNELPARAAIWLADLAAGRPGALGLPPTARREERVLQMCEGLARDRGRQAANVAVAAPDRAALEGLADLVAALGHEVTARAVGRLPADDPTDLVVWEVAEIDPQALVWLRLLADARPARQVVVVTAFPRGDSTLAALRAGARAVLGQPVCLEALAGALPEAPGPPGITLGAAPQAR